MNLHTVPPKKSGFSLQTNLKSGQGKRTSSMAAITLTLRLSIRVVFLNNRLNVELYDCFKNKDPTLGSVVNESVARCC